MASYIQTLPSPVRPTFDLEDAARRLRAIDDDVAIFGAGSNTRALLYALGGEARSLIRAIYDDSAAGPELNGFRVRRPSADHAVDRVAITSPAHAGALAARARAAFGEGVDVVFLFDREATLAGCLGAWSERVAAEWPDDVDDALWHNADALAADLRRRLESSGRWRYGVARQLNEFAELRRDLDGRLNWTDCRLYNFGCGRYHPLGVSLMATALGARTTLATDLEPPLDERRSAEALAELAGAIALEPALIGEGLDVAEVALRVASVIRVGDLRAGRLLEGVDRERLAFRAESIYDARLEPASFDVIVSRAVFEHLPDVPAALRVLAAALAPSGVMALRIDFADHRIYVDPARYRHWSHLIDLDEPAYLGTNRLRYADYPAMFEAAGLRVIDWRPETREDVPREAIAQLAPRYRAMAPSDLAVMSVTAVLRRE
ncbi:MAG: methyltransferase domain-containing protein [Phycisphaerales bacterium]|nr:methyltransferase domain-containing protein [Phycisphaerales bacterium]